MVTRPASHETNTFTYTQRQNRLYDEFDAAGVLSPDMIRAYLDVDGDNAATQGRVHQVDMGGTAVPLISGAKYGPNNHFAPSDRDVIYGQPPDYRVLSQTDSRDRVLGHSPGYLAASEAFKAHQSHRRVSLDS